MVHTCGRSRHMLLLPTGGRKAGANLREHAASRARLWTVNDEGISLG